MKRLQMVVNPAMGRMFDTTCGSLFRELQLIWDEVGESDEERDRLLLQLEQECLEVYRRNVDQASSTRALLQQYLADSEAEIARIYSSLGERPISIERHPGTLRQQISFISPYLEELRQRKVERARHLQELKLQIHKIHCEISGISAEDSPLCSPVNEDDLSLRRLEKYQAELQAVQKEKNDRLQKVLEYVNTLHQLCSVLAVDFFEAVNEVHPSLHESAGTGPSKSISDQTLDRLVDVIKSLEEEKRQRMHKLQDLGTSLIELWTLMDTSAEEQQMFQHVTCQLAALEREITAPGALGLDIIQQAEIEVDRLTQLKGSRIKELVLKKRAELEDICRRAHMESDASLSQDTVIALVESGIVDPSELLASVEEQIGKAKEEAFSRKEIMEKMEKWLSACEEECWLEDYNKDDTRYNASRAAHINLKRAERARATISKIPALVESLTIKARAWEEERGTPFLYDGVRLLAILEEYTFLREEKEQEKRRLRDKKRLQGQLMNEQETLFGSRPSPNKSTTRKGQNGLHANGAVSPFTPANNRRLSLGGAMLQTPTPESLTRSRLGTSASKESRKEQLRPAGVAVRNFISKDDTAGALASGGGSASLRVLTSAVSEKDAFASQGPRTPFTPVPISAAKANILQSDDELNTNQHLGSPKIMAMKIAASMAEEHHHNHNVVVKQAIEYSFEERRAALPCYKCCSNC
ncbi:hypothetical protein O6H91_03G037300 [Diphasiastrum complanatum]|uniref:Uncharacterized protein n=2 Tax=Diphasiastrum complanatum TaxID=34168 RepID=A0ACC2E580_DIPCM|nr:hypothetical protein O6H91_03G037300 [Diphasiastrum complanatum]KAJ7561679.1 hypothetical protein O6H91_03G037300 [Diphasiastrum complanatum]